MNSRSLLAILADGHFHSGTEIGEQLKLSRAAVWKGMQTLTELGVDYDSIRGKGYRLGSPLVLLDGSCIQQFLPHNMRQRVQHLDVHFSLDSTNSRLSSLMSEGHMDLEEGKVAVCLAETQTAGRGRRGRSWVSPFGSNLYFSMARCFHRGMAGLEGMSLVTGVAVVRALQLLGVNGLSLKWPNDVMVQGHKVAGILLEMSSDAIGEYRVVTGIGINVNPQREAMSEVSQPWTALAELLGAVPDRNLLAATLADALVGAVDQFQQDGLSYFMEEWQSLDYAEGKTVNVHMADGSLVTGKAMGISADGGFCVSTAQGDRVFNGGEISLRLESEGGDSSW